MGRRSGSFSTVNASLIDLATSSSIAASVSSGTGSASLGSGSTGFAFFFFFVFAPDEEALDAGAFDLAGSCGIDTGGAFDLVFRFSGFGGSASTSDAGLESGGSALDLDNDSTNAHFRAAGRRICSCLEEEVSATV